MKTATAKCFGFYQGDRDPTCTWCGAARRCKAINLTHGNDLLNDLLTHLMESLPEGPYQDTDRVTEIVRQLQQPTVQNPLDEEAKAIGLLDPDEPDLDV